MFPEITQDVGFPCLWGLLKTQMAFSAGMEELQSLWQQIEYKNPNQMP